MLNWFRRRPRVRTIFDAASPLKDALSELRMTKYADRFPVGVAVDEFVRQVVLLARELEAANAPKT